MSITQKALYEALGQIKGIESTCEQHRSYPWQLQCVTCRAFVAEQLTSLLVKIDNDVEMPDQGLWT